MQRSCIRSRAFSFDSTSVFFVSQVRAVVSLEENNVVTANVNISILVEVLIIRRETGHLQALINVKSSLLWRRGFQYSTETILFTASIV